MASGSTFLREFSAELAKEVRKRPCLYDRKTSGYKDRPTQEAAWQEVGDALGITYDLARKRWHGLRSSYTRSMGAKMTFYLAHEMCFLDPHVNLANGPKNSSGASVSASTSEPELPEEEDSQSDCSIPMKSPPYRSRSPFDESPPNPLPRAATQHEEPLPHPRCKRSAGPIQNEEWQKAAKSFFLSQLAPAGAANNTAPAPSTSSTSGTEQRNPDLEYLKGLLPQIEQLDKRNKRLYFQKISNLLFTMLDEQDEAAEEREAKPYI